MCMHYTPVIIDISSRSFCVVLCWYSERIKTLKFIEKYRGSIFVANMQHGKRTPLGTKCVCLKSVNSCLDCIKTELGGRHVTKSAYRCCINHSAFDLSMRAVITSCTCFRFSKLIYREIWVGSEVKRMEQLEIDVATVFSARTLRHVRYIAFDTEMFLLSIISDVSNGQKLTTTESYSGNNRKMWSGSLPVTHSLVFSRRHWFLLINNNGMPLGYASMIIPDP